MPLFGPFHLTPCNILSSWVPWLATYDAMPWHTATIPKQLGFLVGQRELHRLSYYSLLALHPAQCLLHSTPSFAPCVCPVQPPELGTHVVMYLPFVLVTSQKCYRSPWRNDPRWSNGMG